MEREEHLKVDPHFYGADAHIHLSNARIADINPGKVSASLMYATARFNAYCEPIGTSRRKWLIGARRDRIPLHRAITLLESDRKSIVFPQIDGPSPNVLSLVHEAFPKGK